MKRSFVIRQINNGSIIILKDNKNVKFLNTPSYTIENNKIINFYSKNNVIFSIPIDMIYAIERISNNNILTSKVITNDENFEDVVNSILTINSKKIKEDRNIYNKGYYNSSNGYILDVEDGNHVRMNIGDDINISIKDNIIISNEQGFIKNSPLHLFTNFIANYSNLIIVPTKYDRNNIDFDVTTIDKKVGILVYVQQEDSYYKLYYNANLQKYGWVIHKNTNWTESNMDDVDARHLYWDLGKTPNTDESIKPDSAKVKWDLGKTPEDESLNSDNQPWI